MSLNFHLQNTSNWNCNCTQKITSEMYRLLPNATRPLRKFPVASVLGAFPCHVPCILIRDTFQHHATLQEGAGKCLLVLFTRRLIVNWANVSHIAVVFCSLLRRETLYRRRRVYSRAWRRATDGKLSLLLPMFHASHVWNHVYTSCRCNRIQCYVWYCRGASIPIYRWRQCAMGNFFGGGGIYFY